jgi:hypothetical protein
VKINASEHRDLFYRGSVPKNLVPVEEATTPGVGGLSLSKVLKNLTNMFFSITKTIAGGFGFEMKVCVI